MHASTMESTSTSSTLYQLVTYLTCPLVNLYPSQTVLDLQIFLYANLASTSLTVTGPESLQVTPFTLALSLSSLPPTPIYAACLQSGVAWSQWIHALGGQGQTMYICVMEGNIKVRVGEVGDAITVWSEEPTEVLPISKMKTQNKSGESAMAEKLRAMLDSVRARSSASSQQPTSIALPTLLTTACLSRMSSEKGVDDDEDNSDTESTTSSSLFSEASDSAESMTTASSSSSSPISKPSDLPLIIKASSSPVYVPRHRRTATHNSSSANESSESSIPAHRLPRARTARPTVDKTKVEMCRYNYEGGQTNVMTGGVMLGKANSPVPTERKSKLSSVKKDLVMQGPDSSRNWRVRA